MENKLKKYTVDQLLKEVERRNEVKRMTVTHGAKYFISADANWEGFPESIRGEGIAQIIIVID